MKKLRLLTSSMMCLSLFTLSVLNVTYSGAAFAHEEHHHHHASEDDNVVSVDVAYVDGVVHLLTGKQHGAVQTVWYQSSTDQGKTWSEPFNFALADNAFKFKRGNDARLAVQGDAIVAVWMTRDEGAPHNAGPMMAMRSEDKGETWQQTVMPADWNGPHGFFAMSGSADAIDLVWLDSRQKAGKGAQGLRFTQSKDGGKTWSADITLDAQTCACCWNTTQFNDDNLYVLYRDKNPSDMALGKLDNDLNWQRLSTVGQFGWDFQGCPHVGGGLAFDAKNSLIHATVTTGKDDEQGVYYQHSADQGMTWTKPLRLGDDTAFHSAVAVTKQGDVVAVWDRATENGLQLVSSRSLDSGATWQAEQVISPREHSASHPILTQLDDGVLLMWTETDDHDQTTLKMKRLTK